MRKIYIYITNYARIRLYGRNRIAEIYHKKKVRHVKTGEIIEKEAWYSYGFYATISGAIKRIMDKLPENTKANMSAKAFLKLLKDMEKDIAVKVVKEMKELTDEELELEFEKEFEKEELVEE